MTSQVLKCDEIFMMYFLTGPAKGESERSEDEERDEQEEEEEADLSEEDHLELEEGQQNTEKGLCKNWKR